MATPTLTYPPLDRLKPVAANVWIVDSGPLKSAGVSLPVRMTVLKLRTGELLLHSPTPFSPELLDALEELGPVGHLLAPSFGHWKFVAEWQGAVPAATAWAVPGLAERRQVRASPLRIDRRLAAGDHHPWGEEIELHLMPGAAGVCEAALFHRPSRTLVLTDLIVNLESAKLPALERMGARLAGSLAPHGMAPPHLRMAVRWKRKEAEAVARQLVALAPERVIFAHGRWFEQDGAARLRHSLRWLLG